MYKIDTDDATLTPPTIPTQKEKKQFVDGQTIPPAWWMNMVQNELSDVIEDNGDTLDKADNTQLITTINDLIATRKQKNHTPFYNFSIDQGGATITGRTISTSGFLRFVDYDRYDKQGSPCSVFSNEDSPLELTMNLNVPTARNDVSIRSFGHGVSSCHEGTGTIYTYYPCVVGVTVTNLDTSTIVSERLLFWGFWQFGVHPFPSGDRINVARPKIVLPVGRLEVKLKWMSCDYDIPTGIATAKPTKGMRDLEFFVNFIDEGTTFIHPNDV